VEGDTNTTYGKKKEYATLFKLPMFTGIESLRGFVLESLINGKKHKKNL